MNYSRLSYIELRSPVYRQCVVAYTDFWNAYDTVIPAQRQSYTFALIFYIILTISNNFFRYQDLRKDTIYSA